MFWSRCVKANAIRSISAMKSCSPGLSFSSSSLSAKKKGVDVKVSLVAGRIGRGLAKACAVSYRKFVEFGLDEVGRHTQLIPSRLQGKFSSRKALDGKTEMELLAYEAPRIRLSLRIGGCRGDGMQVLDFAIFPELEYDLPIFCANFFTASNTNIVVWNLNPSLYDMLHAHLYLNAYYFTNFCAGFTMGWQADERIIEFFLPGGSMDESHGSHSSVVLAPREAQHRYLTWRAEKDPSHQVLRRLIGEADTKTMIQRFLFDGVNSLGGKTFLDYFPENQCEDGSVNEKISMTGKSFASCPWSPSGEFVGTDMID